MASIYTNGGHTASTHIHKLKRISDDPPYRYRCIECGARLQRLSGVLILTTTPTTRDP